MTLFSIFLRLLGHIANEIYGHAAIEHYAIIFAYYFHFTAIGQPHFSTTKRVLLLLTFPPRSIIISDDMLPLLALIDGHGFPHFSRHDGGRRHFYDFYTLSSRPAT